MPSSRCSSGFSEGTAEGRTDGEAARLLVGDVHRGQGRVQVAGERDVVVAGQGDVAGTPGPPCTRGCGCPDGD
ncbi:hypothetical protein [Streptomyces sp. NBC_00847]|uniref:hypothetical protein n=1 Tax=unclassified Streptomyces TaxID=2593676 RepID=UPI002B1D82D2|nr:hypothetical protein [Streptomyces sp. NBC_00847]